MLFMCEPTCFEDIGRGVCLLSNIMELDGTQRKYILKSQL